MHQKLALFSRTSRNALLFVRAESHKATIPGEKARGGSEEIQCLLIMHLRREGEMKF